ncbi:Glucosidase II beta subunit [Cordyceps militaris]|uniref:Endoplasmic reticulum lectin n=1 Tax=Cordyceps militaris TaxID=73501 RepID=A0A2H4SDF5_CORMI|nr:Glucosidase II beta subunit [Cordyceps militaris]
MRRATLLLLAASSLCEAKPHSFSIHEDVLAHPEFEVVFGKTVISENDANLLVQHSAQHTEKSQPTSAASGHGKDDDEPPLYTYEMINMGDYRAICSIPVIEPSPAENKTATELAKAEEAREESRAVASGWELIADLEETCLYYVSGWWSYSFCRNTEIVQYHALASSPKGQPPKRDLHSPEYVLGRVPRIPSQSRSTDQATMDSEMDLIPAEIQEKGKQRFLVQKLEGGTICDLTERERTIEVQYHCVPGLQADKISWIKEVTICAYVMVVDTPRLCNDAAFLPPEPTQANTITCNLVSDEPSLLLDSNSDIPETLEDNDKEETGEPVGGAEAVAAAAATALKELLRDTGGKFKGKRAVVGDITVGSRSILSVGDEAGRAPFKLTPPRSFMTTGLAQEPKLQVIVAQGASVQDGGAVESLSREELKKLEIDPETVKDMAAQVQKLAGDNGWRLEVSESGLAGVRELKGYIDEDGDGDEAVEKKAKMQAKQKRTTSKEKAKKEKKTQVKGDGHNRPAPPTQEVEEAGGEVPNEDIGEEEGSQEIFYRDELYAGRTTASFLKTYEDLGPNMAAVRLWPTFIPSVGLDSETSDESGHGVLEMVQFSVAGIERGELWTMDRFVDLILGEIPRLRDHVHGYGPLGRGFMEKGHHSHAERWKDDVEVATRDVVGQLRRTR